MTVLFGDIVRDTGIRLAPDLNFPAEMAGVASGTGENFRTTSAIDTSVGLVPLLSLTGKHHISYLHILMGLAQGGNATIKMTADDVVIWNSDIPISNTTQLMNLMSNRGIGNPESGFVVERNFLLEAQTFGGTCTLEYIARPIK